MEFNSVSVGLERKIFGYGETWITLFLDGEKLARIEFDKNFETQWRGGKRHELLEDVSPADFMHLEYVPQ